MWGTRVCAPSYLQAPCCRISIGLIRVRLSVTTQEAMNKEADDKKKAASRKDPMDTPSTPTSREVRGTSDSNMRRS
jgi:hypothetical protein